MNYKLKLILFTVCAALLTAAAVLYGSLLMEIIRPFGSIISSPPEYKEQSDFFATSKDTSDETNGWEEADMHVMDDSHVENILLIGQDKREGEGRQRSDSMILCSINKDTHEINTVSFMRDMYVEIPEYGKERLNASYMLGGADLLDETIYNNFGVQIDHNVEVDFDGFTSAFADLGNLDIFLSKIEADYLSSGNDWMQSVTDDVGSWYFEAGVNTLTPEQLLAYCRMRYLGNSDWDRTTRQRKVLKAAFEKIKDEDTITTVKVISEVLPNITTDMTKAEMLGYAYTVLHNDMSLGESGRVPASGTYTSESVNGKSVLIPDLHKNKEILDEILYGNERKSNS